MKEYVLANFNSKYNLEDFIGNRCGNSGRYEIIEAHRGQCTNKSDISFIVKCHECAKDPELFGDALFFVHKGSLFRGTLCCGCAKKHRGWTKDQQIVRINRLCKKLNYEFLGFADEYHGLRTKLKLRCNSDGNEWYTSNFYTLLNKKGGCGICEGRKIAEGNRTPDDVAIASFMGTGNFLNGTTFKRTTVKRGGTDEWEVTCPVCSEDEYVKEGLCSGIFKSTMSMLLGGHKPCRCSSRYHWTQEQFQYRIEKIIEEENLQYSFIDWIGEYNGVLSEVSLSCKQHGEWSMLVSSFLGGGRCPGCTTTGYNPSKPGSLYVLGITSTAGAFTGYGISNVYDSRKATHEKNLGKAGFTIESEIVFDFEDGSIARCIESSIMKAFPTNPQEISGFKREATHYHLYNDVVNHVQSILPTLH